MSSNATYFWISTSPMLSTGVQTAEPWPHLRAASELDRSKLRMRTLYHYDSSL